MQSAVPILLTRPPHLSRTNRLVRPTVQGSLAHDKTPTPWDPLRTLGIGLRKSSRGVRFLNSEIPLYPTRVSKLVGYTEGH